jgi:hypothetical protein
VPRTLREEWLRPLVDDYLECQVLVDLSPTEEEDASSDEVVITLRGLNTGVEFLEKTLADLRRGGVLLEVLSDSAAVVSPQHSGNRYYLFIHN